MSFLDDLVNVQISATSATPSRQGFGTLLIAAYHNHFAARTKVYSVSSVLTDMVSDGFLTTDPAYKAAAVAAAQDPSPAQIIIGRRALPPTQVLKFKLLDATVGHVYNFTCGPATIAYTVLAAATTTTVALAIGTLLGTALAATSVVTEAADTITVTQSVTPGTLLDMTIAKDTFSKITFSDTTADPGIATDLTAIQAENNDWYGLTLDSSSKAEVLGAAIFVEAAKKLFVPTSSDSAEYDGTSTTDLMFLLKGLGYTRTGVLFSGVQLLSYSGCGWMAGRLTVDPGEETWMFKSIKGAAVDINISEPQLQAINAKKGNGYVVVSSLNLTHFGQSASGEFLDTVRFVDWLQAEMQVNYLFLLSNAKKVPFTNTGGDLIRSVLLATLQEGVNAQGLAADPAPTVIIPNVETLNPIDKAARNWKGIKFKGTLSGAVHALSITGQVV